MTKKLIGIIDYGSGNIFSVSKCLCKLGYEVKISYKADELYVCDGLILPGVGAFGDAARKIEEYGLDTLIYDYIETGKTLLGICVGMQLLLTDSNEFGNHDGLGIIEGNLRKIRSSDNVKIKVPVIGWHEVSYTANAFLESDFDQHKLNSFYFVHSYSAQNVKENNIAAKYSIGGKEIVAMIRKKNVIGVQFHPERSGEIGQYFLKSIFG